ncbi:MAG TPA: glycerophosphodiester phosphodiesterase [Anaerolineae bacterium]
MYKRVATLVAVLILIGGIAYTIGALVAKPAPPHPWFAKRAGDHSPLVFAHQGGEGIRPSNTMEAFRHAAELGADVLDTDMHLTKDNVLVLMHDQTVDRTTNGKGAIRDLTLNQIQALDAGYNFSPDGDKTFPYRGKGLTVPTVEELFRAFPDKRFGIEIKQTSRQAATVFCNLIRQYNMQGQVLVSSFAQENMDAFRAECPEVATSATENEVIWFFAYNLFGLTGAYSPNFSSLQVPEDRYNIPILTPGFIAGARSRGLAVQPWTINTEADLKHVLDLGVEGINTDYPDRLLALLK